MKKMMSKRALWKSMICLWKIDAKMRNLDGGIQSSRSILVTKYAFSGVADSYSKMMPKPPQTTVKKDAGGASGANMFAMFDVFLGD